ncbi:hypothetical protein BDZ89DRAFT_1261656 [Hymenopellis radicata]|nr:hypothetical protein BDZ89DRAFT_1261656 [Hymenopellis radicata]
MGDQTGPVCREHYISAAGLEVWLQCSSQFPMSYSTEPPKALLDFLQTSIPHSYPRKKHVIDGDIDATHSTYVQLENPRTIFQRISVIQDSTVAWVAEIFESLPPANRAKLLEDISHADPVLLEASASLMLNHHILSPVKVVLNLLWATYLDNKISSRDHTDKRIFYLLRHFRYGFAIRAQHQDKSDEYPSRQDHILTFEPYRLHDDINKTIIRPAGASGAFCSDDEFNTVLQGLVHPIGDRRDNERVFIRALQRREVPIKVQDLPRLAMTIIEEKSEVANREQKPGTLGPNAWQEAHNHIGQSKANPAEGNERKITAQILGYSLLRNCPNFLVSQLDINVLLVVEDPGCILVKDADDGYDLALDGVATVIVDEDVGQRTPREKLFYMVVERALKTMLR